MIPDRAIDIIKFYEGFSPIPYKCPAGKKTIGYGHVIKDGENFTYLNQTEAHELLLKDLEIFEKAVKDSVKVPLKDYQKGALVSFCYNIGPTAFRNSTLLKELNDGNYHFIGRELMRWVFVNRNPLRGLIRRRIAECELFYG